MNRIVRHIRPNGKGLPRLTPSDQVVEELAVLAGIYRRYRAERGQQKAYVETLLQVTGRKALPDDFGVVLWSVGNPDHGQYHGPGVGSPTVFATASTLVDIPQVVAAYIGCFNLGGGNCPLYPVFRRQVHVADVSYNVRLWVPGTRQEIDPATGGAL